MHTIVSAPLHPHFGSYLLDGLPILITGMITYATACLGPVPIAQPHQRVKACEVLWPTVYGCIAKLSSFGR